MAVPEIRLPSGASTWTRPATGVTGSLKVTRISAGEVPTTLPGAGLAPSRAACALAGAAGASRTTSPAKTITSTRSSAP